MASRRPETIAKREKEQARREKRERKQAKKDARALGIAPAGEEADGGQAPLDDVQLGAGTAAAEPLD
jgi:hypothetical protein